MAAKTNGDKAGLDQRLAELRELQAEFDSTRERLQRAEEEKSTVPRRVYERVRAEYDRQLDALRAKMTPLRGALDEVRGDYEEHLGEANASLETIEEELAEVTFRHRIGEFTDEQLDARRADIDERLQKAREEIDQFQSVLEAMDSVTPAPVHHEPAADPVAPSDVAPSDVAPPTPTADVPMKAAPQPAPAPPPEAQATPPTVAEPAAESSPAAEEAPPTEPAAPDAPRRPVIRSRDLETARAASFENPQAWVDEMGPETRASARDKMPTAEAPSAPAPTPPSTSATSASSATAAAATPNPSLVFVSGPHAGQSIPLLKTTLTIGREHDNNIELKDADVARYHARILNERGQFVVEDMSSTTGTWMNGERVQRAALKHGDVIRIGQTEMAIDFEWTLDSLQRSRVDPAA